MESNPRSVPADAAPTEAFGALGHPTRLAVFRALIDAGDDGVAAGELATGLRIPAPTLSFHLKGLMQAELVHGEARGRQLIYRARLDTLDRMLAFLGRRRVEAFTGFARSTPSGVFPMDPNRSFNVLFLCTGNSARSILAEALLNAQGRGRFRAYSAGSQPAGRVNPFALELLERNRIDTAGLRSKSWEEFAAPGAPALDFVFTVCDNAANEVCPVWPGQPMSAHWGIPDPAAVTGDDTERRRAFAQAFQQLSLRLSLFLSLPLAALDGLALQRKLDEIGTVGDQPRAA